MSEDFFKNLERQMNGVEAPDPPFLSELEERFDREGEKAFPYQPLQAVKVLNPETHELESWRLQAIDKAGEKEGGKYVVVVSKLLDPHSGRVEIRRVQLKDFFTWNRPSAER